jgi:hypothetical protein
MQTTKSIHYNEIPKIPGSKQFRIAGGRSQGTFQKRRSAEAEHKNASQCENFKALTPVSPLALLYSQSVMGSPLFLFIFSMETNPSARPNAKNRPESENFIAGQGWSAEGTI